MISEDLDIQLTGGDPQQERPYSDLLACNGRCEPFRTGLIRNILLIFSPDFAGCWYPGGVEEGDDVDAWSTEVS